MELSLKRVFNDLSHTAELEISFLLSLALILADFG
jgi:hypothetical protein